MSIRQSIETKLTELGPAEFQELCDSLIMQMRIDLNGFNRSGSQIGKNKTIKSPVDSYFIDKNNKFVFLEYSTNTTTKLSKLKEDVTKCLDVTKTDITLEEIGEIILCMNFRLTTSETSELNNLIPKGCVIKLTRYCLDQLSELIETRYPYLAHKFLGLQISSGQIISCDEFIAEYNGKTNKIAMPLDNPFIERLENFHFFENTLLEQDIIVISGTPGVGKTKFAIESIIKFAKSQSCESFCVSYKYHDLLLDLSTYLDNTKNYIIFIDDANKVEHINQILAYYLTKRISNLKIVLTVRDYTFETLNQEFKHHNLEFEFMTLEPLKRETILSIISNHPFNIQEHTFQDRICEVSLGNPRIALMLAKMAIDSQDIYSLYDVATIFDKYFDCYLNLKLGDDYLKVLGIISAFRILPINDEEKLRNILNEFGLNLHSFQNIIDQLEQMELIDVKFQHAKISEQNTETYFFYRVFIKDKILPLNTIFQKLYKYTSVFKTRLLDASYTFGYENITQNISNELNILFTSSLSNDEKNIFLNDYGVFIPQNTMCFLHELISKMPKKSHSTFTLIEKSNNSTTDYIINLSAKFFYTKYIDKFLALVLEYVRRNPESYTDCFNVIEKYFSYSPQDNIVFYERQKILIDILANELSNGDILATALLFDCAIFFLAFSGSSITSTRDNKAANYIDFQLPITKNTIEIREKIFNVLTQNFADDSNRILNFLSKYPHSNFKFDCTKILKHDIPYLIQLIAQNITNENFETCYLLNELATRIDRIIADNELSIYLTSNYQNSSYKLYQLINYDDYKSYNDIEYSIKFNQLIADKFTFMNNQEIDDFYEDYKIIQTKLNASVIQKILDHNFSNGFINGLYLFEKIIGDGNPTNIYPNWISCIEETNQENLNLLWNKITQHHFSKKRSWALFVFYYLSNISPLDVNTIINIIESSLDKEIVQLQLIDKVFNNYPREFESLLDKIIVRNDRSEPIFVNIPSIWYIKDEDVYFKTYLQQTKMFSPLDPDNIALDQLLKLRPHFFIDYVENISNPKGTFEFIWKLNDISETMTNILNKYTKDKKYFFTQDNICTYFYSNNAAVNAKILDFMIDYVRINYYNLCQMNLIVHIAKHLNVDFFSKVLKSFLLLNSDLDNFKQLCLVDSSVSPTSGECIFNSTMASRWQQLLKIIQSFELGFNYLPIISYVETIIDEYNSPTSIAFEKEYKFIHG